MRNLLVEIFDLFWEKREEDGEEAIHVYAGLALFPMLTILIFCFGGKSMMVYGVATLLVGVGSWLNRIVVYVNNGKMSSRGNGKASCQHKLIDKDTRLKWLADIINVDFLLIIKGYMSIGDILQFTGVGIFLAKFFSA